ncbi:MAG: SDR family oxidoreductase [Anaerolineae bacterium]|nr:SDR family oxidoreductase [Anaerolineae bacterium]
MAKAHFNFESHAAVVTGAGGGIGRAIALALGAAGAAVVCGDINPDRADESAQAIVDAGGRALAWQTDVANRFQVSAMIEGGRDAFGRLDILVNAAGVYKRGGIHAIDEWDWRRILDVNLTGAFFCTQLLSRVMAEEGGGVIINVASDAAYPIALPEGTAYAASKTGMIGMTIQAAHELKAHNIRVNAICPGGVDEEDSTPARTETPAAPDMIAPLVLFLCSDDAQLITGQAIHIGPA